MNIRRDTKLRLQLLCDDAYNVYDIDGNRLMSYCDDFKISLKNVNFKDDGIIEGRYLGECSGVLIHSGVTYPKFERGKGWHDENGKVKTARMILVENNNETAIIVPQIK